MTEQPRAGELLVGAYLRIVRECDLVMYNQRSPKQGVQTEVDLVGVKSSESEGQDIYICEVATHLDGLRYGTHQESFEKVREKFQRDRQYITELFEEADSYNFEFWSPVVSYGLEQRLSELNSEFDDRDDMSVEMVLNQDYSNKISDLQEEAASTTSRRSELGYRFLQILGHLR